MSTRGRSSMLKSFGMTELFALPLAQGKSSANTSGVHLP